MKEPSADERQMPDPDAGFRHGDHRARLQVFTATLKDPGEQIRQFLGPQAFDADANDGRPACSAQGEPRVEVCVRSTGVRC